VEFLKYGFRANEARGVSQLSKHRRQSDPLESGFARLHMQLTHVVSS
jgi:hypothetical protein